MECLAAVAKAQRHALGCQSCLAVWVIGAVGVCRARGAGHCQELKALLVLINSYFGVHLLLVERARVHSQRLWLNRSIQREVWGMSFEFIWQGLIHKITYLKGVTGHKINKKSTLRISITNIDSSKLFFQLQTNRADTIIKSIICYCLYK
jgi:hypothetical protein